jgi:hypothetical protein
MAEFVRDSRYTPEKLFQAFEAFICPQALFVPDRQLGREAKHQSSPLAVTSDSAKPSAFAGEGAPTTLIS